MQSFLATVGNDSSADFSATLHDAENWSFVLAASGGDSPMVFVGVHESSRTANESFIYFYFASRPTDFQKRAGLHGETDAMQHEPCGLLSDAKGAAYFVGTNPIFAIGNHPDSDEPFVQWERRILKDGPNLHRKLTLGMDALALPLPLVFEEHGILALTGWASNHAIGPAQLDHEFQAIVGVGEVDDGLLESLWFGAHGVPRKPNVAKAV